MDIHVSILEIIITQIPHNVNAASVYSMVAVKQWFQNVRKTVDLDVQETPPICLCHKN